MAKIRRKKKMADVAAQAIRAARAIRWTGAGKALPTETYTEVEVNRVMDACRDCASGHRNRALIALLYRCGLRLSTEALSIVNDDFDRGEMLLTVGRQMTKTNRSVPVDHDTMRLVEDWMDVRRQRDIPITVPLICTLSGKPMSAAHVRQTLGRTHPTKGLAKRAGLKKRLHPHGLRRSYGMRLHKKGVALVSIAYLLGLSLEATTKYLEP